MITCILTDFTTQDKTRNGTRGLCTAGGLHSAQSQSSSMKGQDRASVKETLLVELGVLETGLRGRPATRLRSEKVSESIFRLKSNRVGERRGDRRRRRTESAIECPKDLEDGLFGRLFVSVLV